MIHKILVERCEFCNAEIEGYDEVELHDRLAEHYRYVKCIQGY